MSETTQQKPGTASSSSQSGSMENPPKKARSSRRRVRVRCAGVLIREFLVAGVKHETRKACRAAGRHKLNVIGKDGEWVAVRLCSRCAAPFAGDPKR